MRIIEGTIRYCKNHKNTKGLDAPWCIYSESGKILSSHSSESAAKKHLQDIEIHKSIDKNKKSSLEPVFDNNSLPLKEVVVFLRNQSNKDKPELIDAIIKKFNLSENDALYAFNECFPEGLSFIKKPAEKTCNCTAGKTCNCTDKKRIHSNIEKVIKNIEDFDITDKFIEDLYHVVEKKENIDSIVDKYKIENDAFVLVLYSLLEELHDIISKTKEAGF